MTEKKKAQKATTKKAARPATKAKKKEIAPRIREDVTPYIAHPLRFIDLFCGIGGFRIAFEKAGGECVFSCDYEKTYLKVVSAISVRLQLLAVA
jgi:DNA (cytosine-5)-methyltransferase 1